MPAAGGGAPPQPPAHNAAAAAQQQQPHDDSLGQHGVRTELERALKCPRVQRVMDAMRQAGCHVDSDYFKVCSCEGMRAVGGYSQEHGIILCHDQLRTPSQVASTALHELIHAYDDCRAKPKGGLDWDNCRAHACTEVRAAALSGDCDLEQEMWRGQVHATQPWTWFRVHARCVQRRATLSVALNPKCAGKGVAAEAVAAVMARCLADREPLEPHNAPTASA